MPTRVTLRLVSVNLLIFAVGVPAARAAETPAGAMTERHRAFLLTNCQGCHGPEKQKGKFRVDDLPLTMADLPAAELLTAELQQLALERHGPLLERRQEVKG
jgi:mono/diheme cytochrome c family protein